MGSKIEIDMRELAYLVGKRKKTNKQIAEHFGVSVATIDRRIAELPGLKGVRGTNAKPKVYAPKYIIEDMVRHGFTNAQIAAEVGLSVGRVKQLVVLYNLSELRPKRKGAYSHAYWKPEFKAEPRRGREFWLTVAECVRDGWPKSEIMETFNLQESDINTHFPKYGSTPKRVRQLRLMRDEFERACSEWGARIEARRMAEKEI